jgi:hypothetical protein
MSGHYVMAYASVSVNISMISSAAHPRWPLAFRRLQDKRLGRLIWFFCGLLGVTRGRFLSMISSAARPRWLPPSWIWFPSITGQTPGSTGPIVVAHCGWLAVMAAILDLVSIDYLTLACVDWSDIFVAHWRSSIFTIFHFSLSLIFHIPTDNFPLWAYALRRPCFARFWK